MKRFVFFIILSVFLFTGCKKDAGPPIINPLIRNDLYISGTIGSGDSTHSVYWKNDSMVILPDHGLPVAAGNIFVSGKDVYVAGQKETAPDIGKTEITFL